MVTNNRDLFGVLWNEMGRVRQDFEKAFARQADRSTLAVNVWEDADNVYVEADLPDIDPAQLDIQVKEGNLLSIQGERKPSEMPNAAWIRHERYQGKFHRELALPIVVNPDAVEANYELGVLKLRLPKSESAKPRKIVVKS